MTDTGFSVSIVYVLTNDAMPNMIKIGRTSGEGVERRVAELSRASGVPLPFNVAVARSVHDAVVVERALHIAFAPDRVNPAREFFAIDADRAVAIINAFPGEDLTPQTERGVERAIEQAEPGSLAAVQRFARKRRPPMNFEEMGIPTGSILHHQPSDVQVEILDARNVSLNGGAMSLTRAQRTITGVEYNVQPGATWLYEGRSIRDIYEETYPRTQDD